MCQDTGTAIVKAKKGQFVFTGGGDEAAIAEGIQQTYLTSHLRYSQMAPLSMYEERNTGTNLPAEIKISAVDGDAYSFLFIAKGGGSANKSYLYQETKALLNEADAAAVDLRQAAARSARRPARRTTSPSSSAGPRPSSPWKRRSWPALTTWTRSRRVAPCPGTGSATSSSRPRCSSSPSAPASAPSSAASTSATTCASFACPATAPAVPWRWPCPARPTARPEERSRVTASSSSSWRRIQLASCPR